MEKIAGQAEPLFYSPRDMEVARENFGAMCGHGALAAILGKEVCLTMKYFGRGGWVNIPMMRAAIEKSGHLWIKAGKPPAALSALVLLQWTGPWSHPGVPPAAACRYRHWVATREGFVWDANTQRWEPKHEWKRIIPHLRPDRAGSLILHSSMIVV
jgi:hypothetical protein